MHNSKKVEKIGTRLLAGVSYNGKIEINKKI